MVRIEYEDAVHAVGQATARRLVELLRASGPRYIPTRASTWLTHALGEEGAARVRWRWGGERIFNATARHQRNAAIRAGYTGGTLTQRELAAHYGLSVSQIQRILSSEA